jgi:hypothetical protein
MDFSTGGFLIGGFINLGGPPVFKLNFFWGQWWLINREGFINTHLTLYIFILEEPSIIKQHNLNQMRGC